MGTQKARLTETNKLSRLLTLLLGLCSLVQVGLSSVTFSLGVSGPGSDFASSFGGYYLEDATLPFYIYNYYGPGSVTNNYYIKAYNNLGAEIGSVQHTGVNTEGLGFFSALRVIVLPKLTGTYSFNIQKLTSTITFSTLMSSGTTHNRNYASCLSDDTSVYVYANYYGTDVSFFLSPQVTYYKVDSTTLAVTTLQLEPPTTLGAMSYVIDMYTADYFVSMNTKKYFVQRKDTLAKVKEVTSVELGYFILTDRLTADIAYVSSMGVSSAEYVAQIDLTATVYNKIKSVVIGSTYVTNMSQSKYFRLLFSNIKDLPGIKIIDLDTFAILLSPSAAGNVARVSLVPGYFTSRKEQYGLIDTTNKKFEIYNLINDYCQVPGQNPCVQCVAGRYLNNALLDNLCYKPTEFPPQYGINGYYMAYCLGSAGSGCLACPVIYSTCTQCDNANGFYLDSVAGTCLTIPQIPNGKGVNPTSKLVVACSDANCLICAADNTVCNQCKPSYYLKEGTTTPCTLNNQNGFGLKILAGPVTVIAACSDSNCLSCLADYSQCTQCKTNYYTKTGTTTPCLANNLQQWGLDSTPTPAVLRQCSDVNCRYCLAAYTTCTSCMSSFMLLAGACVSGTPGMGDDGSGNLVPCSVAHCDDCATLYTTCVSCATGYYFFQGSTSSCNTNTIPGKGLLVVGAAEPVIAPCGVSQCSLCYADSTHCEQCAAGYYMRQGSSTTCYQNNAAIWGLKITVTPNVLVPCNDPNCQFCLSDYKTCTQCNTNYYQKLGQENLDPSCFQNNIAGMGLNGGTQNKLIPCQSTACADCFSSATSCVSCPANYYPNPDTNHCTLNNVPGYGLTPESSYQAMGPCVTPNCASCSPNNHQCQSCHDPYLLNPLNGLCAMNDIPGLGKATDGTNINILKQCADTNCGDCFQAFDFCKACMDPGMQVQDARCAWPNPKRLLLVQTPYYFDNKRHQFQFTFNGDLLPIDSLMNRLSTHLVLSSDEVMPAEKYALLIKPSPSDPRSMIGYLESLEAIDVARLDIRSKDTTDTVFKNSSHNFDPMETISISNIAFSSAMGSSRDYLISMIGQKALAGAGVLAILAAPGSPSGGNSFSAMIKIVDSVEFVLFINGIRVLRADRFLYLLDNDFLKLLPNFLDSSEEKVNCRPRYNFAREGVSCNLLINNGSDLETVASFGLVIVFCLSMMRLKRILENKKSKSSKFFSRILHYVFYLPTKIFTARMLVTILDGSQIEYFRVTILNIYTVNLGLAQIEGVLVSSAVLLFYVWYGYSMAKYAITRPRESSIQHDSEEKQLLESPPLGTKPETKDENYGFLQDAFEGFRQLNLGNSRLYLFVPLMGMVKNLITQFTIVVMDPIGIGQLWVILVFELLYLASLIVLKPYNEKEKMILSIAGSLALSCVGLTNILVNYHGIGLSFKEREMYYGYLLIAFYSFAILVGFVPCIMDSFRSLYFVVKALISIFKKAKSGHKVLPQNIHEKGRLLSTMNHNHLQSRVARKSERLLSVTRFNRTNLSLVPTIKPPTVASAKTTENPERHSRSRLGSVIGSMTRVVVTRPETNSRQELPSGPESPCGNEILTSKHEIPTPNVLSTRHIPEPSRIETLPRKKKTLMNQNFMGRSALDESTDKVSSTPMKERQNLPRGSLLVPSTRRLSTSSRYQGIPQLRSQTRLSTINSPGRQRKLTSDIQLSQLPVSESQNSLQSQH